MSNGNEWSAVDVAATLLSRDSDREREASVPSRDLVVQPSPGFQPGQGQYVVDPDYMEILGLEDPMELIRYHR